MFDTVEHMTTLEQLLAELEQQRRSIAMLPAASPLSRERALDVIARCQSAVTSALRGG